MTNFVFSSDNSRKSNLPSFASQMNRSAPVDTARIFTATKRLRSNRAGSKTGNFSKAGLQKIIAITERREMETTFIIANSTMLCCRMVFRPKCERSMREKSCRLESRADQSHTAIFGGHISCPGGPSFSERGHSIT